jgi:hypothetical protein
MWNRAFVKISLIGAAAICAGFAINQFRAHPLRARYASKQERLDSAAAQVGQSVAKKSSVNSVGSDEQRLKAFSELIGRKSENAYERTLEVWKQDSSVEFLRSVISVAKKKIVTTDEIQMLELMLKALDDPAAQWRECERLSRGNRSVSGSLCEGRNLR